MLNGVLGFLGPVGSYLIANYGVAGLVVAYLLALMPVVSLLIEVLEAVVKVTASDKDDAVAAQIKATWGKVLPVLEILPHVNLPLAPAFASIAKMVIKAGRALMAALGAWKAED